MRRPLTVPMAQLQEGDKISLPYSHDDIPYVEETVIESRGSDDGDLSWYIKTDKGYYTQFGDPWKQFTLLLEL